MNCEEFRERIQLLFDEGEVELKDADMLAHIGICQVCAEFRDELRTIDATLRRIPFEPIPASLVLSLRQIAEPRALPSPGWKPDVERAAMYLIPGLLLWSSQWALPANARPYLLALITFIGTFTLLTSIFRPRILGPRRS